MIVTKTAIIYLLTYDLINAAIIAAAADAN